MAEEPHLPEEGEIERKAIELFQKDWMMKHPGEERAPTPEYEELKEGGWLALARSEIMGGYRSDLEAYRSYLEGELEKVREDLGIKPPPELEDLEKKLDRLEGQLIRNREALKRAKEREAELEEEIRRLREEKPALAPPPKPRELTKDELLRLEDLFKATLFRELGRIPRDAMAEFRVEVDTVKTWSYDEAAKHIETVALEISRRVMVRPPRPPIVTVLREVPEVEAPPPVPPEWMVYPTEVPKTPISPLPFPRAPTSEEKERIWANFKYRLAEMGIDYTRYIPAYQERINLPYRSWSDFLKTYEEFLKEIETERPGVFIPLMRIPMPWREEIEEGKYDAICHFIATKLYPSMDELINGLYTYGVTVTPEEVKTAVKKAWKEKNLWFTSVWKEDLESLIGEAVE